MNNITKAAIAATACVLTAAAAVQAQTPARTLRTAARAAAADSRVLIGAIKIKPVNLPSQTEIARGAMTVDVANFYKEHVNAVAPVPAERPGARAKIVRINPAILNARVEQYRQERDKMQRARLAGSVIAYKEAILRGYHLPDEYLEGYFMRRIFPYQAKPAYAPSPKSDTVLYRGMLLTPEELSKILREGFSPKTAKWNAGTDGRPAVSLSSSHQEASHYIFQSGGKTNGVGVIFEVRRTPAMELGADEVLNKTKTIYYSYEDIPAKDIVGVSLWGEYGTVPLQDVLEKAKEGTVTSHKSWTGQFGRMLF